MRRAGLGDAVGIVAALTAVAVLPGLDDPLTYVKFLVLAVGGLALLPWGLFRWWRRWSSSSGSARLIVVPALAALGLAIWSLISLLASGTPWAVGLFGWFGRGDGALALLGAAGLFVTASSLYMREVARAVNWLVVGAAVAAGVGLLQLAGVSFPQGAATGIVTGLSGNQNFAGAYLAIMLPLAVAVSIAARANKALRWSSAALALILALEIALARSLQGPVAAAAGLLGATFVWTWIYRGSKANIFRLLSSGLVVGVAVLVAASLAGVGPLTRLWEESTFAIRQQYWQSALNMMTAMPGTGTGPGSFARFIGEYRPDSYVELLGPNLNVSAAHSISLHIGSTLGLAGLAFWLVAFIGVGVAFLINIRLMSQRWSVISAAVFGALTAYFVQGLVSIDMLPLLAIGWTTAGLVLAAAAAQDPPVAASASSTRGGRRQPVRLQVKAPVGVVLASCALGASALIMTVWQTVAFASVSQATSVDSALDVIRSPLTPCTIRLSLIESAAQQLPAEVVIPVLDEAVALDPRCPAMKTLEAQVALQTGDLEGADMATVAAIEYDPRFYYTWVLRAEYFLMIGDFSSAKGAYDQAVRVQALYPDPELGASDLAALRERLRL